MTFKAAAPDATYSRKASRRDASTTPGLGLGAWRSAANGSQWKMHCKTAFK